MLRRIFEPSEPAWETGDDRAKAELEGSQCVATSSPLEISWVVGVRRVYKPAVAVSWLEGGGGERGDLMRNRR